MFRTLNHKTGDLAKKTPKLFIHPYSLGSEFQVAFPAYITKFQDSRNSSWKNTNIFGRIDPVFSFENTKRKISLGFDIVSFYQDEAIENFRKIKYLQQGLYPIYQKYDVSEPSLPTPEAIANHGHVLSSPPIFEVKFANFLESIDENPNKTFIADALIGWIDTINFTPSLDSGYIIVGENIYPKLYKLNFNFNVIHHYPLGFVINEKNEIKYRCDSTDVQVQFDEPAPDIIPSGRSLDTDEGQPFEQIS